MIPSHRAVIEMQVPSPHVNFPSSQKNFVLLLITEQIIESKEFLMSRNENKMENPSSVGKIKHHRGLVSIELKSYFAKRIYPLFLISQMNLAANQNRH